jgi:murein DD-endopeptidase MepM/ murein hydrolase activator NlpD
MVKFSEFMQHPRVAQMITRLQGVTTPDVEATDAKVTDAEATDAVTTPTLTDSPSLASLVVQAITQDEIVAQTVTTDSESALESALEEDESDQYSETVWEDALHSLPAPQRPLQRLLPMTARVGVLGLVAVAMWWTWPRSDDPNAWVNDARAGDVESLAVVNPVNVEQGGVIARAASPTPDATALAAQFTNIVIVTPTSVQAASAESGPEAATTPDEPIVLEASALVTDANTGAIVIEIPEAVPPEAVPVESLMPALQAEPVAAEQQDSQNDLILVPTATPSPTTQIVAVVDSSSIPRVEIVPAVGVKSTATAEAPTPTVTATEVPTATPPPIGPGRLWSTFTPLSPATSDHFWLGNPFENTSANNFGSPSYQFGSTAGNRYRPHHGLDFSNPSGTPVQAAVEGTVVHAGPDDPELLGPYNNFYGKAVVIRLDQQLPVAGGQIDVFVLYGHLSEVRTTVGEHVQPTDIVGLVGMTGIAIGPHLHVEARLGANTYDHSVNPYLWLKPAEGNGAVAVRVLTANGRTWAGAKVSIARFEGGRAVWGRQIETYLDTENIGPDPLWGENGAMGDAPAGDYVLIANINGESVRANFTVNAGETTFVEIRTEQ